MKAIAWHGKRDVSVDDVAEATTREPNDASAHHDDGDPQL